MVRQGDVAMIKIDRLPEGLQRKKDMAVAYGEVTGHHHTVVPQKDGVANVFENMGAIYVEVEKGKATLLHTDYKKIDNDQIDKYVKDMNERINKGADFHRPQTLTQGVYKINFETEIDPFTQEIRQSLD